MSTQIDFPKDVTVARMRCEWHYAAYLYKACERVFEIPEWEMFGWPTETLLDDCSPDIEALVAYATPPEPEEWYNQVCRVKQHLGRNAFEIETVTSSRIISIDFDNKYVEVDFGTSLRAASEVLAALSRLVEDIGGAKVQITLSNGDYFKLSEPEELKGLSTHLANMAKENSKGE